LGEKPNDADNLMAYKVVVEKYEKASAIITIYRYHG
jgi:hypothetical protein